MKLLTILLLLWTDQTYKATCYGVCTSQITGTERTPYRIQVSDKQIGFVSESNKATVYSIIEKKAASINDVPAVVYLIEDPILHKRMYLGSFSRSDSKRIWSLYINPERTKWIMYVED